MNKPKNLSLVLIVVIINLCATSGISQNIKALDIAEEIYSKLKVHINTGNNDSVLILALELKKLSDSQSLLYYQAKSNYFLGRYHMNTGNFDSSIYYLMESENQFVKIQDTLNIGKVDFYIGASYNHLNNANKALSYYSVGVQWLVYTGDSVWISVINNYIGITYFEIGDFNNALKHIQISLDYLQSSQDKLSIGNTYNTIGNIYRKMKDPENEENAYLHAINILEQINSSNPLGMAYNNLAEIYFLQGKKELGFMTLEKAKAIYEISDFPIGMCGYYTVLSYYYLNTQPPDYKKVIEYSIKSREIAHKYNDIRQFADASWMLGNALLLTNKLNESENVLLEGYTAADENRLANEIVNNSLLLAKVYEKRNQPSKALYYYKISFQYKDSLYSEEKIKKFISLDLNYKFTQKQISDSLRNVMQIEKAKLEYNADIKTQKLYNYFYLIVILLVIIIASYLYKSAIRRKKANQLLRNQRNQITNQKIEIEKYANQVNSSLLKLQDLDQFKQATTSMLVHDLKNPLNTLLNIEMCDNQQERMSLVKISSRQMLNLIMNMLDINRTEDNKIKPDYKSVKLLDIIIDSIDETTFLAEQKEVVFNLQIKSDYSLMADYQLLTRVFANILNNAIKFSPKNERITIITDKTDSGKLRINFIDHGLGIAKEHQQIIFEKYKQSKKKKTGSIKSTGLGLAFCKLAIEAHNWKIGVDSQEGGGACFWIEINDFTEMSEQNTVNDYSFEKGNNIPQVSPEDIVRLKPYLIQLQKLKVYAVTDVKMIVAKIQAKNISNLGNWIEQLLDSVSSFDNKKFLFLINKLLE